MFVFYWVLGGVASLINFKKNILVIKSCLGSSVWIEHFPPKEGVAGSSPVQGVGGDCVFVFENGATVSFINRKLLIKLDGHSILVTPDPIPNSEVKLDTFVFVLSLMGRRGAVYLFIQKFEFYNLHWARRRYGAIIIFGVCFIHFFV